MNRINDELRRDSRKDPEQLEREIDATRAELLATLEELENRLSPRDMIDQLMTRVRRDGGELAGNLGASVRDNPMPALLTSIGIAWMMAASRRHDGNGYRSGNGYGTADVDAGGRGRAMRESAERMRETAGRRIRERWRGAKEAVRHGREAVRHGRESARESVSGTRAALSGSASSMRRRARGMTAAAQRRAERAYSGFDYLWHEQPLVLGAIGLAAGAIAGAALPPTEREDRTFGRMRDQAVERAKSVGAEGARQARERAEHFAEDARRAMKERQSDAGSEPRESSQGTPF